MESSYLVIMVLLTSLCVCMGRQNTLMDLILHHQATMHGSHPEQASFPADSTSGEAQWQHPKRASVPCDSTSVAGS